MTIGHSPIVDTLLLVPGQDFVHDIYMPEGESVPAGTTVDLLIYDITGTVIATWDAAVTSSSVAWDIASEVADTINQPARFRIFVHYSDGTDMCWYMGQVARQEI